MNQALNGTGMKFMKGKYFIDTNFFVYLFNMADKEKWDKCHKILNQADKNVHFVISTQVLNEFISVMLNKFKIHPLVLKSIVDDMCEYEVVETNINVIRKAIDVKALNQLSYWDSLIVSAAKSSKCSVVLSEDMNHGQIIEGVKIQNPFEM